MAGTKSWYVTLSEPVMAGTSQLKAGDYEVKVNGNEAVLTDESNGKSVKVPVSLEHSDRKFDNTELDTVSKDGKESIRSITLGGSNTKIVLSQ